MAEEVKYGNILVSSRKDETLTYARYVKDLKSGKNVEEILEELRLSNPSISLDELDSLSQISKGETGQPVVYAVTIDSKAFGSRNVGVLFLFSDDMKHVMTQIFITHCYYDSNTKSFNGHVDNNIYQYSRIYNNNASRGLSEKGTWSEWSPFIDGTVSLVLSTMNKNIKANTEALNNISAIGDSDIDNIWSITFNL